MGAKAEGESGPCLAAAPKAQDSETAKYSSSQTAPGPLSEPKGKMALGETAVIYTRCWKSGDPPPATLEKSLPGMLYVVPSPATSRGLSGRAVSARCWSGRVGILWARRCDPILLGLGHECEHTVSAIARSTQLSPELVKASYKLVNINMTGGGSQYVEYVLIGYGVNVDALASLQGPGLPGQAAGGGVLPNSGHPHRECLLRRGFRSLAACLPLGLW